MNNGLMRAVAVLLAATLLSATLAAPVQASGGDGGNGQDQYRLAFVFWGLGKTIAKGPNPAALAVAAHLYVQQKIHAMAVIAYGSLLLLDTLNLLTGKLAWTDAMYLAVYGVFYRSIMLQLQNPFTQALFVVWCMMAYLIATSTGIFATQ